MPSGRTYIKNLQKHRAELAFRDEAYDRKKAEEAKDSVTRSFYLHEAKVDHEFGVERLIASRGSGLLNVHPKRH